jgi:hypothetical protein
VSSIVMFDSETEESLAYAAACHLAQAKSAELMTAVTTARLEVRRICDSMKETHMGKTSGVTVMDLAEQLTTAWDCWGVLERELLTRSKRIRRPSTTPSKT